MLVLSNRILYSSLNVTSFFVTGRSVLFIQLPLTCNQVDYKKRKKKTLKAGEG